MTEHDPVDGDQGTTGTPAPGQRDAFVVQLDWLIEAAGGQATLARRARVAERSLRSWTRGDYPKQNDSSAVRRLDAYAAASVPGYPAAAGVPRLTETSGAAWRAGQAAAGSPAQVVTAAAPPAEPAPRSGRRWFAAAAAVVGVAVLVLVTAVLRPWDDGNDAAASSQHARTQAAATPAVVTHPPLPTTGSGTPLEEQTGSLGANTFADPVLLQDQALKIPPNTTVSVRCYLYAPSLPSVLPDGNWYLLETSPWTDRWAPANSFMNGDVPGGPTLHNTDFAVPECS